MRQKGIQRLLYYLIPLMLAFFSLSIIIATVKPTVADSVESGTSVYPFKRGINAFEYGWELTVPALETEETPTTFTNILYKADGATDEEPCFPTLSKEGYLVLHVQTDKEAKVFFNLYDVNDEIPAYAFKGTPYFMSVNELTGATTTAPLSMTSIGVITLPAGSRGAVILNLSGFVDTNTSATEFSTIKLFTMHVIDTSTSAANAGAKVKFGSLGYYGTATTNEVNILTTAELHSSWKITTNTENVSLRQIPSAFDKGVNEFAYGYHAVYDANYTFTPPADNPSAEDWRRVYYNVDNGAFATPTATQSGYFAVQIEATNALSVYPSLYDDNEKKEIFYDNVNKAPTYFAKEDGTVISLTMNVNTGHVDIPAGSKGALIIPATSFKDSAALNWGHITLFILNINHTTNAGEIDVNLGGLGYYATPLADITRVLTLNSMTSNTMIQPSGGMSLTKINYISNEMDTGDNAFAYGAHWSGVPQTEGRSTWSRVMIRLDNTTALDKENGILAIQMEIDCEGELSFLPSVWDGVSNDTQSFFYGTATFISEEGIATAYNTTTVEELLDDDTVKENKYLQIAKDKGVLLLKLAEFYDKTDWNNVISVLITVNTINAYDFDLKIGEIGYYSTNVSNAQVAMQKLSVLADVEDFHRYSVFNTEEPTASGTLDRIANLDTPPAARYSAVSTAGDVGLIFYVEFPTVDTEAAFVATATIADADGTQSVKGFYNKEKGCYAFIVSVLPKYYAKKVTLTVEHNNQTYSFATSVERYCNRLITLLGTTSLEGKLASSLLDYCGAANAFFDASVADVAKKDLLEEEKTVLASSFAGSLTDVANNGITLKGTSLSLESRTKINVYFMTEEDINDVVIRVKLNGESIEKYTVSKAQVDFNKDGVIDENCYVVSLYNIVAKDLDNMYEITIGTMQTVDGVTQLVSDTSRYSALSYVHEIITSTNVSNKLYNMVVALYYYNATANAYFNS